MIILQLLQQAVAPVFIGMMLGCTASSNQQPIISAGLVAAPKTPANYSPWDRWVSLGQRVDRRWRVCYR